MKTMKQETVKFHLSSDTWNRLVEEANESANAGFAQQDWDTKHECERVGKIAEEMAAAKYENGLLTVSRDAFDHIMAELDWIASDYFHNRGGYSGDDRKGGAQ